MIAPAVRLDAFELLTRLGSGGQGEVFLAWPWAPPTGARAWARGYLLARLACGMLSEAEARHLRLAAVKLAHLHAADALHDEHRHLAAPKAEHPHLAQLYARRYPGVARDFGIFAAQPTAAPRIFLALAYEPGMTLERMLRRRAARSEVCAVAVGVQLARAIDHLHHRGVVHHDVRPANVIVRPGRAGLPHCTLIDLGAAETPGAPRRRAVYGAPGCLPPERTGERPAPASPQVDVYGLGLVLRALVGARQVSPALATLIEEATSADGAQRRAAIPTMAAMLERLETLMPVEKGATQC